LSAARPTGTTETLRVAQGDKFEGSHIFEVGGPEVVSYADLMREYARQRKLRRWMIPVPLLTPRLSSLWLGLVTPVYARVGRKLIDSIRHPTVVRDRSALEKFLVKPVGVRFGNRLIDSRSVKVSVPADRAFEPIQRIGGATGWYFGNWLWRVRGWLDLLVGGVGMRRGRRHPEELNVGETLDCWRVEEIEPGRRLRLLAEMKLPGRAWLEFEVEPVGNGARITQTAMFDPLGLAGLAYWYLVWPLHELVFAGMLRGVARAAERNDETR
jgi:hypothetical protein